MADTRQFCPACATPLASRFIETSERLYCPACDFVFWDNPTPVVAGLVEYDGCLLFARNAAWPPGKFGLISGFLEPHEDPADGVVREVAEELGLAAAITGLIGAYGFARNNQLLLVYHLRAEAAPIRLNDELAEYRLVAKDKARYWPHGTGPAVRDWLRRQGYTPQLRA